MTIRLTRWQIIFSLVGSNEDVIFQQITGILSICNPIGRARLIRLRNRFFDPRCTKMDQRNLSNVGIERLGCLQDLVFKPFQCHLFRLSGTNQPTPSPNIAQLHNLSLAHEYGIQDFLILAQTWCSHSYHIISNVNVICRIRDENGSRPPNRTSCTVYASLLLSFGRSQALITGRLHISLGQYSLFFHFSSPYILIATRN